jgi:hypothetical protein
MGDRKRDADAVAKQARLHKSGGAAARAYLADCRAKGIEPTEQGMQFAIDVALARKTGRPLPRPLIPPDRPVPAALLELASPAVQVSSAALQALRTLDRHFPACDVLRANLHPKMTRPLRDLLDGMIRRLTEAREAINV